MQGELVNCVKVDKSRVNAANVKVTHCQIHYNYWTGNQLESYFKAKSAYAQGTLLL